jgi:hypothetical protein
MSRMAVSIRGTYGCWVVILHGVLREFLLTSPSLGFTADIVKIIMFSDLECDYINPIDLCNKLNQVRPISSDPLRLA